jgi:molybdenum cofactor guanylyltransferase
MAKRAAIVLAGGRGQRFQTENGRWQDKALAALEGKPLLIHVVENIRENVDEILVIVNNKTRKKQYTKILSKFKVSDAKIVEDISLNGIRGPLIAILTGLKNVTADYCITIPADMPLIHPKVADYLFREIGDSYVEVPMWPNGRLETLLMILKRNISLEIAKQLCLLGRSHPDDIIRGANRVLFVSPLEKIIDFDPNLCSFVNINSKEDLSRLKPRPGSGPARSVRLNLGDLPIEKIGQLEKASLKRDNGEFVEASEIYRKSALELENQSFFWSAISREYQAKIMLSLSKQQHPKLDFAEEARNGFFEAAKQYLLESNVYEKNKCLLLAERARADRNWCEERLRSIS